VKCRLTYRITFQTYIICIKGQFTQLQFRLRARPGLVVYKQFIQYVHINMSFSYKEEVK